MIIGTDDPKGGKFGVPEFKVTNPRVRLDFLKEILYLNHSPDPLLDFPD